MRYLTLILLLIATSVYAAGESVHLGFTYSDQGYTELKIAEVGIKVDGVDYCQTGTPTVGADGNPEYVCADEDFAPGDYSFQIFLITNNGKRVESQIVMGTVPPEPVVIPDPEDPVIIRGEIQRDGSVVYQFII